MARPALAAALVVGAAFAGVSAAPVVHAGPLPPCTFTLSAPQVVQVDGTSMVAATVAADQCGPPATTAMSVACLQMQGGAGDGAVTCAPVRGPGDARIVTPFVAGATYVATGRGCGAWIGQLIAPDCQLLGPISATV